MADTSGFRIPILDLSPQIESLQEELDAAISRVIRSGRYILGPEVAAFEKEVAEFLGVKHALGCNSGTDALVMSLRALGIGHGDEVITTPFTFFATAEAIGNVGATPVFVDIDPATFNLDATQIANVITPCTKAILPVHLFGQAAQMDSICELAAHHGLRIVEDVAQAFGGRYRGRQLGTLGDVAAFSFFPSKNLGALGDGGLVVTDDDDIALQVKKLRAHGGQSKYANEMLGYNSRLDEIQAAVLRVKLPWVNQWNQARRRTAERYDQLLAGIPWLTTPVVREDVDHVFHQYTVRIRGRDRDETARQLDQAGVQTMVYYPSPVHRLPVFAGKMASELPMAEEASGQVLSLPMGPSLDADQVQRIAACLHQINQSNTLQQRVA